MPETGTDDILKRLTPVTRALGLARLQHWTEIGIAAGAILAVLILVAAHVSAFGLVVPLAIGAFAAGALAGLAFGLRRWPAPAEAARLVDRHFDLHERMTTALQLRTSGAPLAQIQRADVARHTRQLSLKRSRRQAYATRLVIRDAALMSAALLTFVGVLLLGGIPSNAASARAAANTDQGRIRQAALVSIPAITQVIQRELPASRNKDVARSQLELQLALLRHQLLHAQNRSAALRAISVTQLRLRRLTVALHGVDPNTVRQINLALGRYAGQRASGRYQPAGLAGTDPTLAARSLNQLAKALNSLSPAERDRLARTLARAANSLRDPHLRSYLHQAASSLAYNDPPTASRALQRAASFLAATPNARIAGREIKTASQQLERLKNSLMSPPRAGAQRNGRTGGRDTGSSGASSGSRSGSKTRTTRTIQSDARGSGVSGSTLTRRNTGPAPGVAGPNGAPLASGQVTGITARKAGEGGFTADDPSQRHGRGTRGKGATVFVPGVQGRGPHAVQLAPNGVPRSGALVSYRQVIVQYTQSAHAALDRAALPPTLQSYVRRYFDQLAR